MQSANRNVIFLAAFVWFSGGVVLLLKGSALAKSAYQIAPDSVWIWLAPALGVTVGIIKTSLLFSRMISYICRICDTNVFEASLNPSQRFTNSASKQVT